MYSHRKHTIPHVICCSNAGDNLGLLDSPCYQQNVSAASNGISIAYEAASYACSTYLPGFTRKVMLLCSRLRHLFYMLCLLHSYLCHAYMQLAGTIPFSSVYIVVQARAGSLIMQEMDTITRRVQQRLACWLLWPHAYI